MFVDWGSAHLQDSSADCMVRRMSIVFRFFGEMNVISKESDTKFMNLLLLLLLFV